VTLIALLLALLVERLATRLLHLREARWLQGYSRWVLGLEASREGLAGRALCLLLVLLPALPVAALAWWLSRTASGVAWLPLASLVLVFSLGPRDLVDEVGDYLRRETRGDAAGAAGVAREIMEHDAAQRREFRAAAVEDAIFVQANNRIFGVVFWFILLGPAGLGPAAAWLFRVTDLMRRQAILDAPPAGAAARDGCPERLHFLLAWAPARLLALGYALAGSLEDVRRSWRERYSALPGQLLERNDWLLVHVGRAALGAVGETAGGEAGEATGRVRAALRLVHHALLFWLTVIAILSLVAWIA
jgi:membrane protein required for beta-lactamase induction